MKKLYLIFSIAFIFFTHVRFAYAHILVTDRSIGAVLHVDPEDDPIAKEQSSFFFAFKDKQNKFQPQNCDCTFIVNENGSTLYSQPLFQNNNNPSLNNATVFYTFPQRDVYEIKVVGKPITQDAFQPFTLTWNLRVDKIADSQSTTTQNNSNFLTNNIVYFTISGILLIALLSYINKRIINKKLKEKTHDKKDSNSVY